MLRPPVGTCTTWRVSWWRAATAWTCCARGRATTTGGPYRRPSWTARACIAWGGVWAQMVVLAIAGVSVLIFGMPSHSFAAQMVDVALYEAVFAMMESLVPEFDVMGFVRERTNK